MASDILCLVLFLCFLPSLLVAQIGGNISVGTFLTAGENTSPWLSPSQDFAFGFQQIDGKNLYLPAIWYNKIPDRTIVWFASGDNPVPAKSRLQLTSDRGLVLNDPRGTERWRSDVNVGQAAYGFMNDTGNFIVANSNKEPLWQSFDQPTDTLLPTQTMEKGGKLSARLSETNFSKGKFQFRLIQDGNAVLNTNNLPTEFAYEAYFWSNTYDPDVSNAGVQVVFNESGYLYVLRANNKREVLTPGRVVPATEYYHRATLNFDGVFILYSHPRNTTDTGNWSVIRTMPDDICKFIGLGPGPCGFNGVCSLSTDQRPICRCPTRFSLLDPRDEYGGCKPDFPTQLCEEEMSSSLEDYEFVEITNVDWPMTDYEQYTPYNIEECKKACLQDCFCNAIVFRGDTCWKKKLPLSNGRQQANVKVFMKVRKGNFTTRPDPFPFPVANKDQNLVIVVSVLLGGSVLFNFILVGVVTFCLLAFYNKKLTNNTPQVARASETNLRCFSFKELTEATNGFQAELGRGAFGIVYKGLIEMGSPPVPVAVKRLDRVAAQNEKEFRTEVNIIGQTHHKNLVRLLGFCDEGQERLLVYEFLSNGSLASFLFGDTKLAWNQRIQIASGVAKGLSYLHEECITQIIHCDIKPQNILLDDYYNARIADFGLAKLLSMNQSHTYTSIRGTKGYVAPEWFRNWPITVKADVYSFGVLLLEIICCRKCTDMEVKEEAVILTDWAYDCYQQGALNVLIENEEEALNDIKRAERLVMVAIWCIQEDPSLRPTMKKVILMLEGNIQVPAPPCPSPFSTIIS